MAACEPRLYTGVDISVFEGLKSKLSGLGINLANNDQGRIKGPMGVVMDYGYDGAQLAIHVVEKNFLVGCKQIENLIEGALREAGWQGQTPVA